MKKLWNIFLGFLVLISLVLVQNVNAEDLVIDEVEINGFEFDPNLTYNSVYVERGESVDIKVMLSALGDNPNETGEMIEDIQIEAEVNGYEYGDIEDKTSMFDLMEGVSVMKTLTLEIPDDIDASEDYTIHIRAYNDDVEEEVEFTLQIEEKRHDLEIIDVLFTPGLTLAQGQDSLFTTVRVENLGDKKEEDIKVTVSAPELGISQSTYIDELTAHEDSDNDDEDDNEEEDSESSEALYLDLSGKEAGTYKLYVNVEYNNGNDEIENEYTLILGGGAGEQPSVEEESIIEATVSSKSIAQGEGVVYTIDLANLGDSSNVYTVEVTGLDTWATYRVDPSLTTIAASGTGQLYIYVSAKENAALGSHMFTAKVKENGETVKDINLEANVSEKGKAVGAWDNIITGLEVGFIVLLIILVILGLIIAIGKMGKKEGAEEPVSTEGQTYY